MENISIIFKNVTAADPEKYLAERIELLHYASQQLFEFDPEKDVRSVARDYAKSMIADVQTESGLPLSAPIDVSKLVGEDAAQIRDEYACMIKEVKTNFPLTDNEVVAGSEVAYLTEQFSGFEANSVVFKQTTNFSTCYYIYPYIAVTPIDITPKATLIKLNHKSPETKNDELLQSPTLGFSFGSIPLKIAEGLAKTIGTQVGAWILNEIWPDANNVKSDWQKIGVVLEKIVAKAHIVNNLNVAMQQLTAYMTDLNVEYLSRKKAGASVAELYEYLDKNDHRLKFQIVGVFMYTALSDYDMESVTLGNFLVAAGVHLAHLQEKAMLQPTEPNKTAIKSWAQTYINYVRAAIPRIADARLPFISPGLYRIVETRCTTKGDCFNSDGYAYKDDYTGYEKSELFTKKTKDQVHDRMAASRFNYLSATANALKNELATMTNPILNKWQVLVTKPIPQLAEAQGQLAEA